MRKLQTLRAAIVAAVPTLAGCPENLLVFVESGSVQAFQDANHSHRLDYTANLVLLDFTGDLGEVTRAVVAWLKIEQADLLQNPERMAEGFTFEAELTSHSTMDLSIKLRLMERCIDVPGQPVTWPPEPDLDALFGHG
ncbi:phage tail protein [Chitiniphilus eburneus]|uniref:phage tail protein n=1 Tax=Chitiniphilus eburneus TaxID=2571148 RepID=UPI0035D0AD3C